MFKDLCKFLSSLTKKGMDSNVAIEHRRGVPIRIEKEYLTQLKKDNYILSVGFTADKKPTSVHLRKVIDGKSTYQGTLKNFIGAKDFLDKDCCNFEKKNLIF